MVRDDTQRYDVERLFWNDFLTVFDAKFNEKYLHHSEILALRLWFPNQINLIGLSVFELDYEVRALPENLLVEDP